MAALKDFTWTVEVSLTRAQVIALGKLADYLPNIKGQLPSTAQGLNWDRIQEAFHEFRRAYKKDQDCYSQLNDVLASLNKP